jgi:small multidrug resistance pump
MPYLYLALAIVAEVTATSALKASEAFSRLGPSIVVVTGYAISFYLLSLTLRDIAIGVVYAIWSGVGIALISLVGIFWFKQTLDATAVAGIVLIVAGVVVLNLSSSASIH